MGREMPEVRYTLDNNHVRYLFLENVLQENVLIKTLKQKNAYNYTQRCGDCNDTHSEVSKES